jgi:hypothetical protein
LTIQDGVIGETEVFSVDETLSNLDYSVSITGKKAQFLMHT